MNSDILYSEQAAPNREPLKNWSKASYKQYNCMDLNGIVLFQEYKPPWKGKLPLRQGKEQSANIMHLQREIILFSRPFHSLYYFGFTFTLQRSKS